MTMPDSGDPLTPEQDAALARIAASAEYLRGTGLAPTPDPTIHVTGTGDADSPYVIDMPEIPDLTGDGNRYRTPGFWENIGIHSAQIGPSSRLGEEWADQVYQVYAELPRIDEARENFASSVRCYDDVYEDERKREVLELHCVARVAQKALKAGKPEPEDMSIHWRRHGMGWVLLVEGWA